MSMVPGQTVSLEVSKIVHGGYGLGRVTGRVVFIPGVIPGEVVEVRITEVKKSHAFGEAVTLVEPSPHRVDHVWPEADVRREPPNRVGGADFGHIALDHQRAVKREVIAEAMARQGSVDDRFHESLTVQAVPGQPDGTGWRSRVTLHVDAQGTAGQKAFRSDRVIPTDTLPLAHPDIARLGAHHNLWPGETSLHLGRGSGGVSWLKKAGDAPAAVSETVAGHTFHLDTDVFWQVHHSAPEVLTDAVVRAVDWGAWDPGALNADLYGGVGLFSVALAAAGGPDTHLVSVEAHPSAGRFAAKNLSPWPRSRSVTSDVLAYLRERVAGASKHERERFRRATIVADPPRSGAAGSVMAALIDLAPQQVVYVACDPVAFARDQKLLAEGGFELVSVEAFDLFPHTHHVEMVAAFSRTS